MNVHNYDYSFLPEDVRDEKINVNPYHALVYTATPDGTHMQEPDLPQPGDVLRLLDKSTLVPIDNYTVCTTAQLD